MSDGPSNHTRLQQYMRSQQHLWKSASATSHVFKDKLKKTDRINIPTVKLQIDESRKIPPVHINTPFDVSYHLRKPAKEEFREMVNAGIIVPNNEPSDWCSQAFPRLKPGSDGFPTFRCRPQETGMGGRELIPGYEAHRSGSPFFGILWCYLSIPSYWSRWRIL